MLLEYKLFASQWSADYFNDIRSYEMVRDRSRVFEKPQFVMACSFFAILIGCSESIDRAGSGPQTDAKAATADQVAEQVAKTHDEKRIERLPQVLDSAIIASESAELAAPANAAPSSDVAEFPTPVDSAAESTPVPKAKREPIYVEEAKREPIYVEEANGKELIAAALKKAQRDHKHVVIEWGGNWCGWCYRLHDVFHNDELVRPIVHEEFELVLIDEGKNHDLMLEYGGTDRQYSYPHLTILDSNGQVLTNQETGSLEEGPKHDPKLVSGFLTKWVPAKVDAEELLATAIRQAADEDKRVLVRVGTPYCGWCNVLAQFLQDHEALFARDYVDVKIDTLRMTNGKEVAARYEPKEAGGVPWMVILDAVGKEQASSFGPEGNIGYPYQPNEIAHFLTMLSSTRKTLTDAELEAISADLNAYRETRER